MSTASLEFLPNGTCQGLYTEAIDLAVLGKLKVNRLSYVEFNSFFQKWFVMNQRKKIVFVSQSRAACLEWEQQHYDQLIKAE